MERNQVCDGLVHSLGGPELGKRLRIAAEVSKHRQLPIYTYGEDLEAEELCPVGSAVVTSTAGCGRLANTGYDAIAHTPPPIYPKEKHFLDQLNLQEARDQWDRSLSSCYANSIAALLDWNEAKNLKFESCTNVATTLSIATPILGSGARGAPTEEAMRAMMKGLNDAATELGEEDPSITVMVSVRFAVHFKTLCKVFNEFAVSA